MVLSSWSARVSPQSGCASQVPRGFGKLGLPGFCMRENQLAPVPSSRNTPSRTVPVHEAAESSGGSAHALCPCPGPNLNMASHRTQPPSSISGAHPGQDNRSPPQGFFLQEPCGERGHSSGMGAAPQCARNWRSREEGSPKGNRILGQPPGCPRLLAVPREAPVPSQSIPFLPKLVGVMSLATKYITPNLLTQKFCIFNKFPR